MKVVVAIGCWLALVCALAAEDVVGAKGFESLFDGKTLKGWKATNFRFDLMGQAEEVLPLDDPKGMKKAGKSEEGTYCAVPMVHDDWTIEEAIPFWYICENDWRGHVDCQAAYEGTYDPKDYYGWQMLSDCLQKPEKLIEGMASGGVWESWVKGPAPPPFPHYFALYRHCMVLFCIRLYCLTLFTSGANWNLA